MLLDVSCCGPCLNFICIFLFVSAVSCEISFSYDLRLCVISGGSSRGAFVRATSRSLYFLFLLTNVIQVYGGSVALFVGARLRSTSSFRGNSSATAGSSIVAGFSGFFKNCSISDSRATVSTTSGTSTPCYTCLTYLKYWGRKCSVVSRIQCNYVVRMM